MTAPVIKENYKNFFSEVNSMAKERPLVTIIYALGLTALSIFAAHFSLVLAIGIFSISLPFHLSVIKNFKTVYHKFEETTKDIFTGDPKEKAKIAAHALKMLAYQVYGRVLGFFQGLFSKSKEIEI